MPTPNPVLAGNVLTAGLSSIFRDTYKPAQEALVQSLGDCMDQNIPTQFRTTPYGYMETPMYPRRWNQGDTIASKAFRSVSFNVSLVKWGARVMWYQEDRKDDQTKSLFDQARGAGENFGTLDERVFFQILTNTVDAGLLASIPNAPDGAALLATTAGGLDRFGVSGGNIVTGTEVSSAAVIRADFFNVVERLGLFQNTESQPLWGERVLQQGYKVFFNIANYHAFAEAFVQSRTVGALAAPTAAAPTNVIMDAGLRVELVPTQRITNNDWYICLKGAPIKPIFSSVGDPITEAIATTDTSDFTRDTDIEYMQFRTRKGFAANTAYAIVQVNNI